MRTLYYVAYGSNLHPLRLRKRVPSATLIGTIRLRRRKLTFEKRSKDGSGKCSVSSARPWVSTWGALYALRPVDLEKLDRAEGPGYEKVQLGVKTNGMFCRAFTYATLPNNADGNLQPYDWYKRMVLLGARYHRFPKRYIGSIALAKASVDRKTDREQERRLELRQMRNRHKLILAQIFRARSVQVLR